jgi:hypothetical protein
MHEVELDAESFSSTILSVLVLKHYICMHSDLHALLLHDKHHNVYTYMHDSRGGGGPT